jgi:hypothetical protein
MLKEMALTAVECGKLGRGSVWSPKLNQYVCERNPHYKHALAEQTPEIEAAHPAINPTFKLVFLTSVLGSLFFIVLCVSLHLWMGAQMPSPTQKLADGLLDMGKLGFGAIFGLLGGQHLKAKKH